MSGSSGSSDTTSATTDTTTGQTDTSTTSNPDTSTSTTTGETSTGTTIDTIDTVDTLDTFGTTTGSTTDGSTGGTTMAGPVCGDNKVEGDKVCDGTNNNGETCKTIVPGKWGGGKLTCNATCESFDDTMCCIGVGMSCNILNDMCCGGLHCNVGTCVVD